MSYHSGRQNSTLPFGPGSNDSSPYLSKALFADTFHQASTDYFRAFVSSFGRARQQKHLAYSCIPPYAGIIHKKKILEEVRSTIHKGGYVLLGGAESTFGLSDGLSVWPSRRLQTSVDQITAAIFFTNSRKGALIIDCGRSLAFDIIAKLMSIGRPAA